MNHVQTGRGEHVATPRASLAARPARSSREIRADWPEGMDAPHPRAIAMAEIMREAAASAGGATMADLIGKGFTMAEITEHEPAARQLADAAIVRQVRPAGDRVPDIIQKACDAIAGRMPVTDPANADEARAKTMQQAWDRYCTARAAFKLDPWVSQSERCVHLLSGFLCHTPLLAVERNRVIFALAAEQKTILSRRAANG